MGSPDPAPPPKTPAARPERFVDVAPEDIVLGDQPDEEKGKGLKVKGKRSLTRPSSASSQTSGVSA